MAISYFELWNSIREITTNEVNFECFLTETALFLVEDRDEWVHIKCPPTWEELEAERVKANQQNKQLVFSENGPLPDLSYYHEGYDNCTECFSEYATRLLNAHDNPNPSLLFFPEIEGEMVCVGDTHGDTLSTFKLLFQENILERLENGKIGQLIFLGDYLDRGAYSSEMLTLVLWLKHHYPDKVTVLRGNHEYIDMCAPDENKQEGTFYQELKNRLTITSPENILVAAHKVFNALPYGAYSYDKRYAFHHAATPFPERCTILKGSGVETISVAKKNTPQALFDTANIQQMVWGDFRSTGPSNCVPIFFFNDSGRGAGWFFYPKCVDIFPGVSTTIIRGHQWQQNMMTAINLDMELFKRTQVLDDTSKVITCFSTGEEETSGYHGHCVDPYYAILDPKENQVTFRSINAEKIETIIFGMVMDLFMQQKLRGMYIENQRLHFEIQEDSPIKLSEELNELLRLKLIRFGHLYSFKQLNDNELELCVPLEHSSNALMIITLLTLKLIDLKLDEQVEITKSSKHKILLLMLVVLKTSTSENELTLKNYYYEENQLLMEQKGFQSQQEKGVISVPCFEMLQKGLGLFIQEELDEKKRLLSPRMGRLN